MRSTTSRIAWPARWESGDDETPRRILTRRGVSSLVTQLLFGERDEEEPLDEPMPDCPLCALFA